MPSSRGESAPPSKLDGVLSIYLFLFNNLLFLFFFTVLFSCKGPFLLDCLCIGTLYSYQFLGRFSCSGVSQRPALQPMTGAARRRRQTRIQSIYHIHRRRIPVHILVCTQVQVALTSRRLGVQTRKQQGSAPSDFARLRLSAVRAATGKSRRDTHATGAPKSCARTDHRRASCGVVFRFSSRPPLSPPFVSFVSFSGPRRTAWPSRAVTCFSPRYTTPTAPTPTEKERRRGRRPPDENERKRRGKARRKRDKTAHVMPVVERRTRPMHPSTNGRARSPGCAAPSGWPAAPGPGQPNKPPANTHRRRIARPSGSMALSVGGPCPSHTPASRIRPLRRRCRCGRASRLLTRRRPPRHAQTSLSLSPLVAVAGGTTLSIFTQSLLRSWQVLAKLQQRPAACQSSAGLVCPSPGKAGLRGWSARLALWPVLLGTIHGAQHRRLVERHRHRRKGH